MQNYFILRQYWEADFLKFKEIVVESDIGHQKDNQGYNERNIQKAFV